MRSCHLRLVLLVVLAALMGSITPAAADTQVIRMETLEDGNAFIPSSPRRPIGTVFRWRNVDSSGQHTATRTTIITWDFTVAAGETSPGKRIKYAGTFMYFCRVHEAMNASLGIRPRITPDPEEAGSYLLTLGTELPPGGLVFDVQRRLGTGAWTHWRTGTSARRVEFRPSGTERHAFRARLRQDDEPASRWSPQVTFDPS